MKMNIQHCSRYVQIKTYTISLNVLVECFNRNLLICLIENLARDTGFKGTPSQSSSYPNNQWGPEKAVDGLLQEGVKEDMCSFTVGDKSKPVTSAWWKLPLNTPANVAYLQIQFRNSSMCL